MTRCTDVVRVIEATGMHVAIAGDRCALYLYTPQGMTRVLMPLERFCEAGRAETDCNGNPFPSAATAKETRDTLEQLKEDAEEARRIRGEIGGPSPVVLVERAFAPSIKERSDDGERPLRTPLADYAAGWEFLRANLTTSTAEVARRFGFDLQRFQLWMQREHRAELATLRDAAGLNRVGRPKSAAPVAAQPTDAQAESATQPDEPATLANLRPLPPRTDRPARERALRRAWGLYIASPDLTCGDIARPLDCTPSYLRARFDEFAAAPGAPALKPNGKL